MRWVSFIRRHAGQGYSLAMFLMLGLMVPSSGRAQAAPAHDQSDAPVCLGFSFGRWVPALDWHAAGHVVALDSARVPLAAGGRGWATSADNGTDTTLMLFPPWWPAGVSVQLATRTPMTGDTTVGRATALIADGRAQAPTSRVRAWRVPCNGSGSNGPAPTEAAPVLPSNSHGHDDIPPHRKAPRVHGV